MATLHLKLAPRLLPRILLVDGEPALSNVLRVCIASLGYEVRRSRNRAAAVRAVRNWTPDLVITSIRKSCEAARERYLKVHRAAQVPILLVRSSEDQRRAIESIGISADEYLTRPFSIAQILETVLAITQKRVKQSATARSPHYAHRPL